MTRALFAVFLVGCILTAAGCIKPKITVFPDDTDPLEEYTLQGKGTDKILVIHIRGFISDNPRGLPFARRPGTVQQVVSQLNKAREDRKVKAVILKIDSAGGSVTASDMLYHEITRYKERSGVQIVAMMMGVAASGGYYVALPADHIMAHPTSITGSIGVVFLRPNVTGLMGKVGVEIEIDKSGANKDMGSPFRKATQEEQRMVRELIDGFAEGFISLAVKHRRLSKETKGMISTGRIYSAHDALGLGLIDGIGYLDDAISEAARLSGISEKDPKVIVYRRTEQHDDNMYITSTASWAQTNTPEIGLIAPLLADLIPPLQDGLYYLWLPGRQY
jgi:protease-4